MISRSFLCIRIRVALTCEWLVSNVGLRFRSIHISVNIEPMIEKKSQQSGFWSALFSESARYENVFFLTFNGETNGDSELATNDGGVRQSCYGGRMNYMPNTVQRARFMRYFRIRLVSRGFSAEQPRSTATVCVPEQSAAAWVPGAAGQSEQFRPGNTPIVQSSAQSFCRPVGTARAQTNWPISTVQVRKYGFTSHATCTIIIQNA